MKIKVTMKIKVKSDYHQINKNHPQKNDDTHCQQGFRVRSDGHTFSVLFRKTILALKIKIYIPFDSEIPLLRI